MVYTFIYTNYVPLPYKTDYHNIVFVVSIVFVNQNATTSNRSADLFINLYNLLLRKNLWRVEILYQLKRGPDHTFSTCTKGQFITRQRSKSLKSF